MVGLDQKDSYAARCLAHRHFLCSGMCKTGIAGWIRRSLLWFAGPDARHHGRYVPEGLLRVWLVFAGYDTPRAVFFGCRQARR